MDPVLEAANHMHADQPHNPLHGVTLEVMLQRLVAFYGWSGLGERIRVNCFNENPSIPSSLKFLRKTPWARKKVESLYVFILPDLAQAERGVGEPGV